MDGVHKCKEVVVLYHRQYRLEWYQNSYLEASSCIAGQEIVLLLRNPKVYHLLDKSSSFRGIV
jgi:hypothetical protein